MSKNKNERLFSIFKRFNVSNKEKTIIRVISLTSAILLSLIACSVSVNKDIFTVLEYVIQGNTIDIWRLVFNTAILLAFGIAIIAPFKMKYWFMGAGGTVMISALAAYTCIVKLVPLCEKGQMSNIVLLIIMFVASLTAGIIWAVIPSLFKAFFNTNETLFTLMMNYVATGVTSYVNYSLANEQKINPGIVSYTYGVMPEVINKYFLSIIIIILITVFMTIYINKTKHGFEVTVMGDSERTAKYVGMNTKWITIRTLLLSGVICGILGFLYIAAKDHMASEATGGTLGFTGILVAWISNFNTITMAIVSFFLTFLTIGTEKVCSTFNVGNSYISSICLGVVFFAVLVGEFFIQYRVRFNFKKKEVNK